MSEKIVCACRQERFTRRYQGVVKAGHQPIGLMFFKDPSGNALECKAFRDMDQLFAT